MELTMYRAKDGVRFEVSDDEVSSSVTLTPEDDKDSLIRKLKRVIALAEPAMVAIPAAWSPEATEAAARLREQYRQYAPQLTEEQVGNGWEKYAPDDLPEEP